MVFNLTLILHKGVQLYTSSYNYTRHCEEERRGNGPSKFPLRGDFFKSLPLGKVGWALPRYPRNDRF